MANKKRRCTSCKKYKVATDGIAAPIGFFCDKHCQYDYAIKNMEQLKQKSKVIANKVHKQKKKAFKLTDVKHQRDLTQAAFNKMRVLEEKLWFTSRGLEPECISCRKKNMDWCCGHFKTRGSQGNLRYDRKNTYLQCNRYCNMGLSGNISGNKNTRGYVQGLRDRFGDEAEGIIEYCTNNTETKKYTGEELVSLRKEFSKKIKDLL